MVQLTREETAKHNTEEDLWMIIDHKVYDLSEFVDAHPGGSVVLVQTAGQDATEAFFNLHRNEVLQKYQSLCLGEVAGEKSEVINPQFGDLSTVPYAEPTWLSPLYYGNSYFKDSHRQLQKAMRKFVDEHITPEALQKEQDGTAISQELIDKMADNNLLAMRLGPGPHMKGRKLFHGVMMGDDFANSAPDAFHDMIVNQEIMRPACRGFQDGNMAGMTISLTAIHHWLNDEELKKKVSQSVLSGKDKCCLAVTEAFAGSDVNGIRTTAELSADGSHYIVNGTKKWITNGHFATLFVTACKIGDGMVVLMIPRSDAVTTRLIKTTYSTAAQTTYIQFENAKVPISHRLGSEKNGFQVVMSNFNHERWMLCCHVIRGMRLVLEECLKWSHQRIVFGKRLIDQPVIRAQLARIIGHVEANQAYLENVTFQMSRMDYSQQSKLLGGPIALLKTHATRAMHEVANEAVHIFGGRAITQGGMARVIEAAHRTYPFDALLGGAEGVLGDLGVKQAMKNFPKGARL